MPTPTYTALANVTLSSSANFIVFSSIPATYRDLILVINGSGAASVGIIGRLNADAGNNYSTVRMFGIGSGSGTSDNNPGIDHFLIGITTSTSVNTHVIQIMDYSATNKHKAILTRNSAAGQSVNAHSARYASNNAITAVNIFPQGSTWSAGTTASLYGIAS
jgi:hypothetical protein